MDKLLLASIWNKKHLSKFQLTHTSVEILVAKRGSSTTELATESAKTVEIAN
jgi:hypothetical protein